MDVEVANGVTVLITRKIVVHETRNTYLYLSQITLFYYTKLHLKFTNNIQDITKATINKNLTLTSHLQKIES